MLWSKACWLLDFLFSSSNILELSCLVRMYKCKNQTDTQSIQNPTLPWLKWLMQSLFCSVNIRAALGTQSFPLTAYWICKSISALRLENRTLYSWIIVRSLSLVLSSLGSLWSLQHNSSGVGQCWKVSRVHWLNHPSIWMINDCSMVYLFWLTVLCNRNCFTFYTHSINASYAFISGLLFFIILLSS